MKIRIKFRKYGNMRFVGHLDLMRYFQRAIRRAGIDIAYTEGFNPHPVMSFAAPLGLGLTSDGEYMDIEVHTSPSTREAIDALNSVMAEGVKITEYVLLKEGAKKAMAAVSAADYIVYFKHREDFSEQQMEEGIRAYYTERDRIPVIKQSKKTMREIDLKPLLYKFAPYTDNGVSAGGLLSPDPDPPLSDLGTRIGFFLRLCTGSSENIRPEFALGDFYAFAGRSFDPNNLQIHRLELYESDISGFLPLHMAGSQITQSIVAL